MQMTSPVAEFTPHTSTEDGYAREHVRYPDGSKEEEEQRELNRLGPKSERRSLPWRQDDNQESLIASAVWFHDNAIAMALITIAMKARGGGKGCPPPWAYPEWQKDLYGAMTNTFWEDARNPHEHNYGLTFREAGALVALLDSVTGGRPGQTYTDHYLMHPDGTADAPDNKMAEYLRKLGFHNGDFPESFWKRKPRHSGDASPPAYLLLPYALREAISLYIEGTEGMAALLMRVAPPKLWRPPSPGPWRKEEHEAFNAMAKRDREGPAWETPMVSKRARPASALA